MCSLPLRRHSVIRKQEVNDIVSKAWSNRADHSFWHLEEPQSELYYGIRCCMLVAMVRYLKNNTLSTQVSHVQCECMEGTSAQGDCDWTEFARVGMSTTLDFQM